MSKEDVAKVNDLVRRVNAGTEDYFIVNSEKIRNELENIDDGIEERLQRLVDSLDELDLMYQAIKCPEEVILGRQNQLDIIATISLKCLRRFSAMEEVQSQIEVLEDKLNSRQEELFELAGQVRTCIRLSALSTVTAKESLSDVQVEVTAKSAVSKTDFKNQSYSYAMPSINSSNCVDLSVMSPTSTCVSSSASVTDIVSPYSPHERSRISAGYETDDLRTAIGTD